MKRKPVLCGLLAAALLLSLAACSPAGKAPTAEELVSGIAGQTENCSATMTLDMKASVDTGADLDGLETMDMGLSAKMDVETSETASHISGSMTVDILSFNREMPIDTYIVRDGDDSTAYTYDSESGSWHSAPNGSGTASLADMNADLLKDLSLAEDGDAYVVTGTMSMEDSGMSDLSDVIAETDSSGMDLKVTITFDKSTRNVRSVTMGLAEPSDAMPTFDVEIKYDRIGGVEVTVPQEVLDSKYELDGSFSQ